MQHETKQVAPKQALTWAKLTCLNVMLLPPCVLHNTFLLRSSLNTLTCNCWDQGAPGVKLQLRDITCSKGSTSTQLYLVRVKLLVVEP